MCADVEKENAVGKNLWDIFSSTSSSGLSSKVLPRLNHPWTASLPAALPSLLGGWSEGGRIAEVTEGCGVRVQDTLAELHKANPKQFSLDFVRKKVDGSLFEITASFR